MIAVVIPTLNEEAFIGKLLSQLLDEADHQLDHITVADGGSSDNTCAIVRQIALEDQRVRLVLNPRKLQAAGVNLAARQAGPRVETLVRVDAHADYPSGYVSHAACTLREMDAQSVVVRLKSEGTTCLQRAIAAVGNSRWGTGGAAHRMGGDSRWIDHGHHAAFDLSWFLELGGYDEAFAANEDAEFDIRLSKAGGRIWFAGDLEVLYRPRRTLNALGRQYFRYGRGRAQTVIKTRTWPKLRQSVTPFLLLTLVLCFAAAPFAPSALLIPSTYVVAACGIGIAMAIGSQRVCLALGGAALIVIHLAWAAGFLFGLFKAGLGALKTHGSARLTSST